MEAEDFLAHFGVKGMKWGQRKAGDSGSSGGSDRKAQRQADRAEYKANLKSAEKKRSILTGKEKPGEKWTPAEVAALKKSSRRQVAASLAIYGALQVGGYAAGKALEARSDRKLQQNFQASATRGAQYATRNMSAIGDLTTFTLRKGANGSWG